MNSTIRNAFKSLDEIVDVKIYPVKSKLLKEDIGEESEPIETDGDESGFKESETIEDLFKASKSYIMTPEFEHKGRTYSLFIKGLNDGESCDLKFSQFEMENITEIVVQLIDDERHILGDIGKEHPEWNDLSTPISEVIDAASIFIDSDVIETSDEVERDVTIDDMEDNNSDDSEDIDDTMSSPESDEETEEKIAQHIIPDHSKDESLTEDADGCESKLFPGLDGDIAAAEFIENNNLTDYHIGWEPDQDGFVLTWNCGNAVGSEQADEPLEESHSEGREKFNKHHRLYAKISAGTKEDEDKLTESKEFNISDKKDLDDAKEVLDAAEEDEPVEQIVDINADTVDDLKKSYIGSAILQCPTCKTMIYKSPDDLVKSEEGNDDEELYNEEEECPHCGATDGFELVGQVASLDVNPEATPEPPMVEPTEEQPAEEPKEDKPEEEPDGKEPMVSLIPDEGEKSEEVKESLTEDGETPVEKKWGVYQNIEQSVYRHNPNAFFGFVEKGLTKEEAEKKADEMNTPEAQKAGKSFSAKDTTITEDYHDIVLESLDEAKFNRLAKKYLSEVYSNIESYVTVDGHVDNEKNQVILEGKIKFKSGKVKDTKFVFEAKEITRRGRIKLVGINETFAKKKAFTLVGSVDGTSLLSESLTYSYKENDKKIYGQVKNPVKVQDRA